MVYVIYILSLAKQMCYTLGFYTLVKTIGKKQNISYTEILKEDIFRRFTYYSQESVLTISQLK